VSLQVQVTFLYATCRACKLMLFLCENGFEFLYLAHTTLVLM